MRFKHGFEYIKNSEMYYQPKTPSGALRAAEEGLLPVEAFIYKAASIEPIFDTPENLEEIERILAQKNRDLETTKLLIALLNKLIQNPDKEVALFAAESINSIENSYNRILEELKEEDFRKRAELYLEMAELNKSIGDLKTFYLREAFSNLRNLEKSDKAEPGDYLLMADILAELGMLTQARKTIEDNNIRSIEAEFKLADIAFREKDYSELYTVIARLDKNRDMLDINQTALVDFWMGSE